MFFDASKNEKFIIIKRSIEVDDDLKEFIFKNSNYRRKVWNDFVSEYKRCRNSNEKFDPTKFRFDYFHNIEIPNNIYDTHVTGISEQVYKDIIFGIRKCNENNGELKFRKFDRFRCSFKVHCKPYYHKSKKDNKHHIISRVKIKNPTKIEFGDNGYHKMEIKLKEPLYDINFVCDDETFYSDKNGYYTFSGIDIKTISFLHELGKFYICLAVNVNCTYDKNSENKKRLKYAGIDLGIRNALTICDKNGFIILNMPKRLLTRIEYLFRRTKRLQKIMDRKFVINKKRGVSIYSKNYIRVQEKFRKTWKRIVNIRLDWRRKISKLIVTRYNNICVDTFYTPTQDNHLDMPIYVSKYINSYNRRVGMYDLSQCIITASRKYNTRYIEAPKNTTRTCSKCGHVNKPVPLGINELVCEECGSVIDRDLNASKNCYKYLKNNNF